MDGDGKKIFQYLIIGLFGFFTLIAVLLFSGVINIGGGKNKVAGKVTIWGTIPSSVMDIVLESYNFENKEISVKYVNKDAKTMDNELVISLASGNAPDIVMMPDASLYKNKGYIFTIPYDSFPSRYFIDTFIEGAEIYMKSDGFYGYPFVVDPLVLYYNRDHLTDNGISAPPSTWSQVLTMSEKLSVKDENGNIKRSAIALGEYNNINHAKDIIATLILQAGTPIVKGFIDQSPEAILLGTGKGTDSIDFYTSFSNPFNKNYSWNKSMNNSVSEFVSGDLSFYIGYASELFGIREKNPNLNFDVAILPQIDQAERKITLGKLNAFAITRGSQNQQAAVKVASDLSLGNYSAEIAKGVSLPPARRDLYTTRPVDSPYLDIFYRSGLLARTWLDPDWKETEKIFGSIINTVVSGKDDADGALSDAEVNLQSLLR